MHLKTFHYSNQVLHFSDSAFTSEHGQLNYIVLVSAFNKVSLRVQRTLTSARHIVAHNFPVIMAISASNRRLHLELQVRTNYLLNLTLYCHVSSCVVRILQRRIYLICANPTFYPKALEALCHFTFCSSFQQCHDVSMKHTAALCSFCVQLCEDDPLFFNTWNVSIKCLTEM